MRNIVALLFLTLCVSVSIAQDKRPMTPEDVAMLKNVSSAIISEDGNTIAYTVRVQADPKVENKPASSHLYIYDREAGTSTAFLTRSSVYDLSFRPAHNSITFRGRLDGAKTTCIYEISLNGGEAGTLVEHATSISGYDWNSDGTKVAFVATEPSAEKDGPDLPYQPEIYEGELNFSRAWTATVGESATMLDLDGNVEGVVWSPDDSHLLMSMSTTPLVDDHYMTQQLYIYNLAQQTISGSVDHSGKLGQYCWSPNGNSIAFIAGADINDPTAGRLFVASSEGGTPKMVSPNYAGAFDHLEWLKDDEIYFVASKGTASVVGAISPDGGQNNEAAFHTVSIASCDMNADGSMCMVASTPEFPHELFYSDSHEKTRLTNSNPWLSEIALGEQESITYKASDGLDIEGVLIKPVDYDESRRYPLLVAVHGGPEAHLDNGWLTGYSYPGQVAAGKGYAVFYPNYRGSTGRGLEYVLTSQGDAAGKEFDDIVDGVDHLVEIGLADADKVGVTGGSYGGYATAWLSSRYTDKFAAGVMFVGISDKVSKWGTTDIPNEEYLVHAREWVYDNYDFFLKRSPIYYAGQCKTPLLIMHGEEDTRVDPGQSFELYRHIKTRTDTPVRLVLYPGEGHGNRRATARLDYSLRSMRWFNQYLKGDETRPDTEIELQEATIQN